MTKIWEKLKHMNLYSRVLIKWIAVGTLVGVVGGVIGSLFHLGVHYATLLRQENPWILYLLPVGGVLIAGIYKLCRLEGKGTNAVIESVHFGKDVPILLVPAIFVCTVITHLCGGSAGREGAALQLGGGITNFLSDRKILRFTENDRRVNIMCGMSAGFAALFGTPMAAAIFSLEVVSIGIMHYSALVPCVISALVAHSIIVNYNPVQD